MATDRCLCRGGRSPQSGLEMSDRRRGAATGMRRVVRGSTAGRRPALSPLLETEIRCLLALRFPAAVRAEPYMVPVSRPFLAPRDHPAAAFVDLPRQIGFLPHSWHLSITQASCQELVSNAMMLVQTVAEFLLHLVHETTASGRATRRASSDPACLLPSPTLGSRGRWLRGHGIGPRGQAIGVDAVSRGASSAIHAPNGGNPTWTAPSGGHPNTTSSGCGWL